MHKQDMPKEGVVERAARLEGRIKRAAWCLWVIAALFLTDRFPNVGNIGAAIFYAVSGYFILKTRNVPLIVVTGAILFLGALISLWAMLGPPAFISVGYLSMWLVVRLFLEFLFALFLLRAAQAARELKRAPALDELATFD